MSEQTMHEAARLREEIIRLGPWHLDVQVTPELSSGAFLGAPDASSASEASAEGPISFISPRQIFLKMIKAVYPDGLEGRSFLDCACNCGGYSFWMKEIGAGSCFGFDVREHWIKQAQFLLEHREWPSDGIRFEQLDLYDLARQELGPFDITLFKGIFYHLPDPVAGLKLAGDLTRDLLILDTDVRTDLDDGTLVLEQESIDHPMSGVYGLNWLPTGPMVIERILHWMGFGETRVTSWVARRGGRSDTRGRLQVIGARDSGRLAGVKSVNKISRAPRQA